MPRPTPPSCSEELVELLSEGMGKGPPHSLREVRVSPGPRCGGGAGEELPPSGMSMASRAPIVCGGVMLLGFLLFGVRDGLPWLRGRVLGRQSVVLLAGTRPTKLRWLAHPMKCLDVAGTSSGAGLQVWDCDQDYPYQQEFYVPADGTTGRIKWAQNPELCLDAPGGVDLQFWYCDKAPAEHMLWTVSPDGKGRIHVAADPKLCVDVPGEHLQNGWKLQVWPCRKSSNGIKDQDMRFITHPVDCQWGEWMEWGPCSAPCGGGARSRARTVGVPAVNGGEECNVADGDDTGVCGQLACTTETTTPALTLGGAFLPATTPDSFAAHRAVVEGKRRGGAARAAPLSLAAAPALLAAARGA
mmetsp:Transcript_42879/g.133570  ORF Transcript_42879/g.133570 Transcript_42879/m.133570 type:complete len:357 (+) Transcript_42879:107-1177(+)